MAALCRATVLNGGCRSALLLSNAPPDIIKELFVWSAAVFQHNELLVRFFDPGFTAQLLRSDMVVGRCPTTATRLAAHTQQIDACVKGFLEGFWNQRKFHYWSEPLTKKAHIDRVQRLEALQERSPATTQEIQISVVKQPTVFEDLKKQGAEALFGGGFPQEMIIGRAAMLGFLSAMTTEIESGCSVWQQLSVRGGLALIVMVAVLAGSLTPRNKDVQGNGLDCSANPLGPFTARAERLNGQAAMVGFALLLAIESVKGSAVF